MPPIPRPGDGNLFAYGRGSPVNFRDETGAGPEVGIPVCIAAGVGLGLYNVFGVTEFGAQLTDLRRKIEANDRELDDLQRRCASPEEIAEADLERINLAAQWGRTQAAATLQDAIQTALVSGGAAVCGLALALPTP